MSDSHVCPVCTAPLSPESEDLGAKIECGHCRSVHRVVEAGGDLAFKVLIEALDPRPWRAPDPVEPEDGLVVAEELEEVASNHVAAGAPRVKLKTWRDRWREEASSAGSAAPRRSTVTRGRRLGRG